MKRLIIMALILALVLSLAACGNVEKPAASGTEAAPASTDASIPAATNPPASESEPAPEGADPIPESTGAQTGSKVLVVYFSSANTVDAVSAATPYFDGVASTAVLANLIVEQTGADLAKITPVRDYPESYNDTADYAKQEQNEDARPEFLPLEYNPEDYDVIFIGYPMWWYTIPMLLDTFFDTYDFTGKTLIPFNTHEGSRDGGTWDTIRDLEPGAAVPDGIAIRGRDAANEDTKDQILAWLSGLALEP